MKKSISDILWELIPHENKYVITEKDLLDYITNLQQAVKDTKETADDMLYELNEENERLKDDLKGQENLAMAFSKTSHDYYQRIEKAVEYIKVNNSEWKWSMFGRDELLNILGGEDNDK